MNGLEAKVRYSLDNRHARIGWHVRFRALSISQRFAVAFSFGMQASLVVVSGVLGLASASQTGDWRWIVGAVLILANGPYRLLGIMPTNYNLKAIVPDAVGPTSRAMIGDLGSTACRPNRPRHRGDAGVSLGPL
jgi:hypothetical protein